jgi:hypothetical protein
VGEVVSREFVEGLRSNEETAAKTLKELSERIGQLWNSTYRAVTDYSKSSEVSHAVADNVLANKENRLLGLELVHRALHKVQHLLTFLKLEVLSPVGGISTDSKLFLKSERVLVLHEFMDIKLSVAQKEQYLEYILLPLEREAAVIDRRYRDIKSYIEWMDSQCEYLLRLESGIRLGQRIDEGLLQQGEGVNSGRIAL